MDVSWCLKPQPVLTTCLEKILQREWKEKKKKEVSFFLGNLHISSQNYRFPLVFSYLLYHILTSLICVLGKKNSTKAIANLYFFGHYELLAFEVREEKVELVWHQQAKDE